MSEAKECLVKETGGLVNDLVNDTISRQAAIRLVHSVLYEMMVDAAATDIEKPMSKEDKLLVKVNQIVCTKLRKMPSAQPEIIRCKDCKHKHLENMVWVCPFGLSGGENFFCGYGAEPYKGGQGEADD